MSDDGAFGSGIHEGGEGENARPGPADDAPESDQETAAEGDTPRKPTSDAIIERNRRNAQFSTGPRSRAGKSIARWNAIKHGELIREVVIPTGQGAENREQVLTILAQFRIGLDIRGLCEELLAERLAVTYWKMRRHEIAEVGELRLSLDFVRDRVFLQWYDELEKGDIDVRTPLKRIWRNAAEDFQLLNEMEEHLRKNGDFTQKQWTEIAQKSHAISMKEMVVEIRDNGDSSHLDPKRRAKVLTYIKKVRALVVETRDIAAVNSSREMRMRTDAEFARCHAPELPRGGFLQRRESSFDMQFHRTLRQLERVQSKRGGGPHMWVLIGEGPELYNGPQE